MNELEKLKKLIKAGYKADRLFPKAKNNKYHCLLLWRNDGINKKYLFSEQNTLKYAEELVKKYKIVVGYWLCIYCCVVSEQSSFGKEVDLDRVIESIKKIKSWNVIKSEAPNSFEIHFEIEIEKKQLINRHFEEIDKILLLLSLKNHAGYHICGNSCLEKYKGSPYSIKAGLPVTNELGIDREQLPIIDRIYGNNKIFLSASALREIYSQITNYSKMIVGWAAIEDLFSSSPKHIFSSDEINAVLNSVASIDFLENDSFKLEKLEKILKDSNIMSEKNRNERIAKNISNLINQDYGKVLSKVKNISKHRGKLAHSIFNTKKVNNIGEDIKFIELILKTFIKKNGNITFYH